MNQNLKNIASGIILIIGLFIFLSNLMNNNLNLALVSLTSTLILWVLYGLILDSFNIKFFIWVISSTGFLLALSIFFLYGIEEVPHPIGAIIFHSGGIAGALGIGLFSLFPILILHQLNDNKKKVEPNIIDNNNTPELPELDSDDWELVSEEDLESGEFESQ
tara:strand:- start:69 stop:554 length:486 start_codon:yes stop_codon:yes gene_type:complete